MTTPQLQLTKIEFEDITIKLPELLVFFRGKEIHASLTQLRILMIFLSDPYRRFTNAELVTMLQLANKPALATLINSVRSLLDQQYIVTIHAWGYAFAVERRYAEMNGILVWGVGRRKNQLVEENN